MSVMNVRHERQLVWLSKWMDQVGPVAYSQSLDGHCGRALWTDNGRTLDGHWTGIGRACGRGAERRDSIPRPYDAF